MNHDQSAAASDFFNSLLGAYTVHHTYSGDTKSYRVLVDDNMSVRNDLKGSQHVQLLEVLSSLNLELFFITDDRRYLTTANLFPDSKVEMIEYENAHLWHVDRHVARLAMIEDVRNNKQSINVKKLAKRLGDMFREDIASAGISIQRSANAIYADILRKISQGSGNRSVDSSALISRVYDIHKRMRRFVGLGSISDFDVDLYVDIVSNAGESSILILQLVLDLFIDSLSAQLDGLEPSVVRMDAFLFELNNFYTDKEFRYSYNNGLSVFSGVAGGEISLDWLSSGERQLFIILASVFLAQSGSSRLLKKSLAAAL